MDRVRLLPSGSHMQVKAHVRGQDPAYAGSFPCTQNLKNILVYARTELCMHEYKLHIQARAHAWKVTNRNSSSTFSRKYHPKSILDMFLSFLRH